ncbi:MAG TPA: hypothetical protein VOA41_19600 [Candidatus Dormibacteraeota bacterium]|nr:hypothetical protein [Candidatus Dormibacteraeota bacterium]
MITRTKPIAVASLLFLVMAVAACPADKILWKPLEQAMLSVEGKAPPFWNVYTADKQNQLLLVQLWKRYLMVDTKEQAVYDIDPKTLSKKGTDLELPFSAKPAKPLPSADWATKDMGVTYRLRFKLAPDGRLIEVQIPHRPDLRGLY